MARLTIEDLKKIKEENLAEFNSPELKHLLICGGTGCHATGSIAVMDTLIKELKDRGLDDKMKVVETGCNGFCAMGPILVVHPDGTFYQKLTVEAVKKVVEEDLIGG